MLELQKALEALGVGIARREAVGRVSADVAAGRFHLSDGRFPPPVVLVGGTGTGKSTIVNRILGVRVCAASFRRTFTAGAVAVVASADQIPPGWLGIARRDVTSSEQPAGGVAEALTIAPIGEPGRIGDGALVQKITLVDTPDLDGDRPAHHAQADRAFRWARAVVFVVTPEKYQMTELLPYYRLARRYALPALFVMNKCEESAVVEDYAAQLAGRQWADATLFVIPRDDAAFEPPAGANLSALREKLAGLDVARADAAGLVNRMRDLVTRTTDQVLGPLRADRLAVDRISKVLHAMTAPSPGVDVSPVTAGAQRRFQQRSVLYLMGPQRIVDRVRQLPNLVAWVGQAAWGTLVRGRPPALPEPQGSEEEAGKLPDFGEILADQLRTAQSRVDDVLRGDQAVRTWIEAATETYKRAFVPAEQASDIAADELGQLRQWVEANWSATPRDTALLMKALKRVPGGAKLVKLLEASPYLFCFIADVATHGVVTPSVMIANYIFGTWLGENIVNEVKERTRAANRRIAERFDELARSQVDRVVGWLEAQAPSWAVLNQLESAISRLAEAVGDEKGSEGSIAGSKGRRT